MDLGEESLDALLEQRGQHVVLLREVIVDGTYRDPGALGDVLDARAVKATLGEDLFRGVKDRVAEERARLVATSRGPVGRIFMGRILVHLRAGRNSRSSPADPSLEPAAGRVEPADPSAPRESVVRPISLGESAVATT